MQVLPSRLPLAETGGISSLLSVLKDIQLPWSVRQLACQVLNNTVASATACAEFVQQRGLDVTFSLLDAYVTGKLVGGGMQLPPSPQPPQALAKPPTPAKANQGGRGTTPERSVAASARDDASMPAVGDEESVEPDAVDVADDVLALLGTVSRDASHCGALVEAPRLRLLMAAFKQGMGDFRRGHHRVATGVAQVLFELSQRPALLPALAGSEVVGPMEALVERGIDYAACDSAKSAQVLHGAWAAAALLEEALQRELDAGHPVVKAQILQACVRLLAASGTPLSMAMDPTSQAGCTAAVDVSLAGLTYLQGATAQHTVSAGVLSLLQLLGGLAADVHSRQELLKLGTADAAKQLLGGWRDVQWPAKRLLHLLGVLEVEYRPFVRYGPALLAALLEGQGVDPGPFLERKVDAHILLSLEEPYLRNSLGLDDVAAKKVVRVQQAHAVFNAVDAVDGAIDGCMQSSNLVDYLTDRMSMRKSTAEDLTQRVFEELHVPLGEPISFMQFMVVWPWLDSELEAYGSFYVHGSKEPGASASAGQGMSQPSLGGSARPSKRQRVMGPMYAVPIVLE